MRLAVIRQNILRSTATADVCVESPLAQQAVARVPAAREPRLRTHPAYFYAQSESRLMTLRSHRDLSRSEY